ncbi:DUF58 domain-containing protein [Pseudomonas sp. ME-P-057]|uniref:DUF58 domain-containing protein n=1 Tax=Pseudomonas sp. ME-P-057 TaxID=3040321 RepID=UPI0025535718|nr:DUF58 domain-containing protein [Pseudomonas sp. ME-P-057]
MKSLLTPSKPLLGWLAVLLGVSLLLGVLQALGRGPVAKLDGLFWVLLSLLTVVAVLDALWLWRLPSPRIKRHMSSSLAMGRWSEVRVELEHDSPRALSLSLFDHGPSEPHARYETVNLPQHVVLRPQRTAQLTYRLRFASRGDFSLEQTEIHIRSPLRLWFSRRYLPDVSTVRVYPDFSRLHNGQLPGVENWLRQMGVRQHPRRGLGLEFHQLREFREGDSLRQIDWKATARHRAPIAREYQDERDQQILFMLDCGRRMRSQDADLSHFDHALNACLLLAYVALRQGDAVGVSTFAGDKDRYLAPVRGASRLNVLLNQLYDVNATQRPADYAAAVNRLLARQKRRALVVMITNLRDEDDEQLLQAVKQLSRHHRVLVASLREGVLDDLRRTPVQTWQQAMDYCGAIETVSARGELHDRLLANRIPVLDVRPSELGPELVSRYMSWKKAGAL